MRTTKAFWIVDYMQKEFKSLALVSPVTITNRTYKRGDFAIMTLAGTFTEIHMFEKAWDRIKSKYDPEYKGAINIHALEEDRMFKNKIAA